MNVLSLFDGMSCGRIALERVGIKVDNYFASEVDKNAIKVSKDNWTDVINIGDVTKVRYAGGTLYTEFGDYVVGKIDLLIAGSPCQGFSMAGKQLAFEDTRSKLYFEFERIKNECQPQNFLLENVKMAKEYENVISERLNVTPVIINSNLVSAQNRHRLYWTDIANLNLPEDKGVTLKDVLTGYKENWRIYTRKPFKGPKRNQTKAACLCAQRGGDTSDMDIIVFSEAVERTDKGRLRSYETEHSRRYSPEECEMLQTVPVGYTKSVSARERYTMLGNGWTVDVIAHILKGLVVGSQ